MEAERRSTMSSLKGQLSNVEGSVKSMKVAVVVGSVLTVACLAAVFGVTVLANEVSKEVKVSNGALTSKSGDNVVVASLKPTTRLSQTTKIVTFKGQNLEMSSTVNSIVFGEDTTVAFVDGAIVTISNGVSSVEMTEGTLLKSTVSSIESRSLNAAPAVGLVVGVVIGVALEQTGAGEAATEMVAEATEAVIDTVSSWF